MLYIQTVPDLRLHLDGSAVTGLVNTKGGAIAVYLAMSGGMVPRQRIAGLLWSDMADGDALNNLRFTLSKLRRQLPGAITATRHDVAISSGLRCEVDVDVIERTEDDALLHMRIEDFLSNLHPPNASGFYDWIAMIRTDLSRRYLARVADLARRFEQAGQVDLAALGYRRCLALEPWAEEFHRALARLHAERGDHAGALAQLVAGRETLRRELDVAPEAETDRLEAAIRDGRQRGEGTGTPPRADAAATGEGDAPEQADADDVGMVAERARLRDLLMSPASRIVTVLGPGGAGKTHLAGIVARRMARHFADGLTVVRFDDVESTRRGGTLMLSRLAESLGCDLVPGRELRSLAGVLQGHRRIVLLDNFETVTDAAPVLAALSEQAPGVKFVATSRHQLGLATEWVLRIKGLEGPQGGTWRPGYESLPAVALFLRAAARLGVPVDLQRDGDAVVRICAALEGWPLGLLLAASWMQVLRCGEIAARLEGDAAFLLQPAPTSAGVIARHESVAAVLEQSWQLLGADEERAGFAALCVFAGRFDAADAQAVAGVAPQVLSALVGKSLVRREATGALSIHPLLRDFGRRRLEEEPGRREHVHAAHRVRSIGALAAARAEFDRTGDPAAHDGAVSMLGCHLAVLRRMACVGRTDAAALAGFVGDFWLLYRVRGWIEDGLAMLDEALAIAHLPPALIAQWQLWRSDALFQLGRIEASDAAAQDMLRRLGEKAEGIGGGAQAAAGLARLLLGRPRGRLDGAEAILAARACNRIAQVRFFDGDRDGFVAAMLRAVTYRGAGGMPGNLASSALVLNYTPFQRHAARLVRLAEERLPQADPFDRGWTHELIALHVLGRGALAQARMHALAGADIFGKLGQRRNWAECQALAAYCPCFAGELDLTLTEMAALSAKGARLHDAASELWGALGMLFVDLSRGGRGEEADVARLRSLAEEVPDPNTSLLLHGNLAWRAARQGDWAEAMVERQRFDAAHRAASMLSVYALNGFVADACALALAGGNAALDAGPGGAETLRRMRRFAKAFPAAQPFVMRAEAALQADMRGAGRD